MSLIAEQPTSAEKAEVPVRNRRQQRGRRVVLWALGVVLVTQLVAVGVLDRRGLRVRFPAMADKLAQARALDPQIVFLGSSRTASTIDPNLMTAIFRQELGGRAPRICNAAVPAGDLVVSERVLDGILRHGRRPGLVVVEICPESVNWRDVWLEEQVKRVLEWHDLPEVLPSLRHMSFLRVAKARFLPLYTHRYQLRKQARLWVASLFTGPEPPRPAPPLPPVPQSDAPIPERTPELADNLDRSARVAARELKDYRPGGMNGRRLERLLARCQRAGITVALLGSPVCSAHRKDYTPAIEAAFQAHIAELQRRYGCLFIDRRDGLPDPLLLDHHHASYEGGIYFTRHLTLEAILPLWKRLSGV
jgi:hypothetical protein